MTGARVVVRRMTAQDLPAVLELMEECLAGGPTGARSPALFQWKHEQNPFGSSSVFVAEADGMIVGLRCLMRWEFGLRGTTVHAARAVDTATRSAYRGQGIFRELTKLALEDVGDRATFVFNTPNANSLPANLRLGWEPVANIPVHVAPVRLLRFLRGLRSVNEPTTSFGDDSAACSLPAAAEVLDHVPDLDALLADIAVADQASGALHTRRTNGYLRWRYVQPPGLDYRAIALHDGGQLRGLAIGRLRRRGSLRELTLSELMVRPGDTTGARRLLGRARRSGVDHVATHFPAGSPGRRMAAMSGFVRAPMGMTMVTRILGDSPVDPRRPGNWRLSIGDLEVF